MQRKLLNHLQTLLEEIMMSVEVKEDLLIEEVEGIELRKAIRIFINLGKMDGANPANLMGFINDHVTDKVRIGKIDLLKNFFFRSA